MLAQRRAVEVAETRRRLEQLEDAPSEENCALAGRLFLDAAAGGEVLEAWRQYSGQITPDDPELRQLLEAWRQLGHERRKKVLEFSQEQLALSLLRAERAILGSVQTPEEAFEIVRNLPAGRPRAEGRGAVRRRPRHRRRERRVMPMQGARRETAVDRLALTGRRSLNNSDAQLDRQALDYARELHATASDLRRGAERWRLPPETSEEYAERLGTREWVHGPRTTRCHKQSSWSSSRLAWMSSPTRFLSSYRLGPPTVHARRDPRGPLPPRTSKPLFPADSFIGRAIRTADLSSPD